MKRWKPVLIGAAVFLGLIAAFVAWVQIAASNRWAETLRRTKEIEDELAAPVPRAPVRGEALPGNAWDDYAAARPRSPLPGASKLLEAFLKGASADPEAIRGVLAEFSDAIETLRRGTRRAHAARPPGVSIDSRVVQAARAAARTDPAPWPLLVDLIRIGQDEAAGARSSISRVLGYATAGEAANDLLSRLASGGGARQEMEATAREARILEETGPPPGGYLRIERIDVARKAEDAPFAFSLASGGPGWRFAGSGRLHLASVLDRLEDWARTARERRERPWREVKDVWRDAQAEAERTGDEFLGLMAGTLIAEHNDWDLRARLRLVHAGALYRARGERADIPDPYGGSLIWDDEGVRSRGVTDDPKDDIILRLKP